MTRILPPQQLQASAVPQAEALLSRAAADIFKGAPSWQMPVAMAAIYRFRPDLGVEPDPELHALHMRIWPRQGHTDYFLRLCRLMKLYGIGGGI
jgi:hypothetical protein